VVTSASAREFGIILPFWLTAGAFRRSSSSDPDEDPASDAVMSAVSGVSSTGTIIRVVPGGVVFPLESFIFEDLTSSIDPIVSLK
jgi:hypothetical protein